MSKIVMRRIGRIWSTLAVVAIGALLAPLPAAAAPAPALTEVTVIPIMSRGGEGGGIAVDPGLHRLYVIDTMTLRLTVIDTRTNVPIHEYYLPIRLEPSVIAVDPVTHRVYIGDYGRSLSIIDGVNLVETARVALPHEATDIAVDSVAGAVWITGWDSGTVTKLDAATGSVLASVSVGFGAARVAVDPAGGVFVNRFLTGAGELVRLNSLTAAIELRMASTHPGTGELAIDPTSHMLYAAWVTGDGIASGAFAEIDPVTLQPLRTVAVPAAPRAIAVGAGGKLWVSGSSAIRTNNEEVERSWDAAVDLETFTVTAETFRPWTSVGGVELDPEGRGAYFIHQERLAVVLEAVPGVALDPTIHWPGTSDCAFAVGQVSRLTLPFFASGAPQATWTVTGNVPPGLALTRFGIDGLPVDPPAAGPVLDGDLDPAALGEYRFTVTARNSGGSDSVTCTITVTADEVEVGHLELGPALGGETLRSLVEPNPWTPSSMASTTQAGPTIPSTHQVSSSAAVSVSAAAAGPHLSATGSPLTITAAAASVLLVVGAAATVVARRRHPRGNR